jgi:hypothetical protein
MLFPHSQRPSLTPIQNTWYNYGFVHFNLYIPGQQAELHYAYGKQRPALPVTLYELNPMNVTIRWTGLPVQPAT